MHEVGWLVHRTGTSEHGRRTEAKVIERRNAVGADLPFAGFGPFLEERLGTLDRVLQLGELGRDPEDVRLSHNNVERRMSGRVIMWLALDCSGLLSKSSE